MSLGRAGSTHDAPPLYWLFRSESNEPSFRLYGERITASALLLEQSVRDPSRTLRRTGAEPSAEPGMCADPFLCGVRMIPIPWWLGSLLVSRSQDRFRSGAGTRGYVRSNQIQGQERGGGESYAGSLLGSGCRSYEVSLR